MLEEGEQFYDYPELLERYRDRVLELFGDIKTKYPEMTHVSVFGEMFGGLYPHDGVKPTSLRTVWQTWSAISAKCISPRTSAR